MNTESTYDWENDQWNVPIGADSPDSGPKGWGFRFNVVLLFPK
jgi:hypothetical protein